jgi:hypothetical protein
MDVWEKAASSEVSPSLPAVPPGSYAVELRFFLTPEELDEAARVRKVGSNLQNNRLVMRLVCGVGAFYLLYLPHKFGGSWSSWLHNYPVLAVLLGALIALDAWIAMGQFGVARLNRVANRLDLERRIALSDQGVDVSHGRTSHQKKWQDFSFFQETPTVFLLQQWELRFGRYPSARFLRVAPINCERY